MKDKTIQNASFEWAQVHIYILDYKFKFYHQGIARGIFVSREYLPICVRFFSYHKTTVGIHESVKFGVY